MSETINPAMAQATERLGSVSTRQRRASHPHASAWVSANAGSGKTHVLSERVIRLLLQGVSPSAILCLTYTRAAAAEMSNRVFTRLSQWATLDDQALAQRISEMEGGNPGPATIKAARQLFARALETPGGLKIQTIHAFCEAVLHRFPLEANIAGHFEILDGNGARILAAEAERALLTAVSIESNTRLAEAFSEVIDHGGEHGLQKLLEAITTHHARLGRFLDHARAHGGINHLLRKAFEIGDNETEHSIRGDLWPAPGFSGERLRAYRDTASASSGKNAKEFAEKLRKIEAADTPERRWELCGHAFFTSKLEPSKLSNVTPKDVKAKLPDSPLWIKEAQDHVTDVFSRMNALHVINATKAALTLAEHFLADYEALKNQTGKLDFNDLVSRTADLLGKDGGCGWVHYKLDQGVDHILLDEAQDTAPEQWSVVRALSEEFFSGATARNSHRTLFSVGDIKQSIYSFQGAQPELFDLERRQTRRKAEQANALFEDVTLSTSFRSTAEVLRAVDLVFAGPDNRKGLGPDAVDHESMRLREPGLVEIWEPVRPDPAVDDDEDWTAAFDATPERSPPARLARRIVAAIEDMIGHGLLSTRQGTRRIKPGDILVLVRKRDGFVPALTRELKRRTHLPVAGADRLRLSDHIAIQDLMALGRATLSRDDDLSLAAVLKSPLFGFDEDDLFHLAAERDEGQSVHQDLSRLSATGDAKAAAAFARLEAWRTIALSRTVHDFYALVLARDGGRKLFLATFGSEVSDVLDEFLNFTLEHERNASTPGLQAFLENLALDPPEIKREMEQGGDQIRVMTVHASKGLEAPVVFLVDPGSKPADPRHFPVFRSIPTPKTGHDDRTPSGFFWNLSKAKPRPQLVETSTQELTEAASEEYNRLLYVGMTRAADRLIMCGYKSAKPGPEPTWLDKAETALRQGGAIDVTHHADGQDWQALRLGTDLRLETDSSTQPGAGADKAGISPVVPPPDTSVLASLAKPPPPSRRLPRPLLPSGASTIIDGDLPVPALRSPLFAGDGNPSSGLERGRILHRLLQVLPDLAENERAEAGKRYLERIHTNTRQPDLDRTDLLASVLAILDDPDFAAVFSPHSRAEVAIMGTLTIGAQERAISGRIDRLAILADRVLIVDYKTNRPPAATLNEVPEDFKRQLAIYRALLSPLYPEKPIEAALLYTQAPRLLSLPADILDAAFAALQPDMAAK